MYSVSDPIVEPIWYPNRIVKSYNYPKSIYQSQSEREKKKKKKTTREIEEEGARRGRERGRKRKERETTWSVKTDVKPNTWQDSDGRKKTRNTRRTNKL